MNNSYKKIITWALFFFAFLFLFQNLFNKKTATPAVSQTGAPVSIEATSTEFASGEEVKVILHNYTKQEITLPSNCPANPLRVVQWTGEKFEPRSSTTTIDCSLSKEIKILPEDETTVSFTYWNYALFGTPGRYRIEADITIGNDTTGISSPEFTVVPAGFFRKLFRAVFYQPIYNSLILFLQAAPAHDLGLAIILLTIAVRLILLVPSQRSMTSQRRMQELQPKLEEIKKKYAGNQERIAQETMALWKQHKVNPLGSCLPLLIQFPVLIALFYVIQNGLNPDNIHLIYTPLKGIDLGAIHTNFLGILELTQVNRFVLPFIVGMLQFGQLKLAMARAHKNKGASTAPASEMEAANKSMVYIMPVMIAVFTASTPAGVGLYWAISTLFAIGQQFIVNKKIQL